MANEDNQTITMQNLADNSMQYLVVNISNQLFGIAVCNIRDVLSQQKITPIPLAPREVAGSLNLRGRIVTAIDLATILGIINDKAAIKKNMSVVVEHGVELYSLIVHEVGEVLTLMSDEIITNPENFSNNWRDFAVGIYPLAEKLLVVLDIAKIFKPCCINNN